MSKIHLQHAGYASPEYAKYLTLCGAESNQTVSTSSQQFSLLLHSHRGKLCSECMKLLARYLDSAHP